MAEKYKISKSIRRDEERKAALENFYELLQEKKWEIIGIATSTMEQKKKQEAAKVIADFLKQKGVSCSLISEEKILSGIVLQKKEEEILIVDLPLLDVYAAGVQTAKKCETVMLAEIYGKTQYKKLEENLKILQEHNVAVSGVVLI